MPDSVQLPQGVRRYRFQGGCGEHEENGRMLLNPRWCLDGEWISIADLPTILAAERERWEEELLSKKAVTAVRVLYAEQGINIPPARVRGYIQAALDAMKGEGDG